MNLPFQWKLSSLVRWTYIFFGIILLIHIYQLTQSYLKVKEDFMIIHEELVIFFREKLEPVIMKDPAICDLGKIKNIPCPICKEYVDLYLSKYKTLGMATQYSFFNNKPTVEFQWSSKVSLIPNREAYYEIHFNRETLCQK